MSNNEKQNAVQEGNRASARFASTTKRNFVYINQVCVGQHTPANRAAAAPPTTIIATTAWGNRLTANSSTKREGKRRKQFWLVLIPATPGPYYKAVQR